MCPRNFHSNCSPSLPNNFSSPFYHPFFHQICPPNLSLQFSNWIVPHKCSKVFQNIKKLFQYILLFLKKLSLCIHLLKMYSFSVICIPHPVLLLFRHLLLLYFELLNIIYNPYLDYQLLTIDSWSWTLDSCSLTLDSWLLNLDACLLHLDMWRLQPQTVSLVWYIGFNCQKSLFQLADKVVQIVWKNLRV